MQLDLISVANNDEVKEVSFTATQPFDEVELWIGGISAKLLESLSVYYAFVGENTMKTATQGSTWFPNAHLHDNFFWTNIMNSAHIVDNDLDTHAYYGTLSGLLGDPRATVDFGKDIPAGSEVGFVISQVDILNLSALCNIKLETYDKDDNLVDKATFGSVLDLSVVKVGNKTHVSMITTKPCRQLYIAFLGLEVKLGGTNVYYAYARDAVTVDVTSRFSAGNVTINTNYYTLPTGDKGKTQWQIVDAPSGTLPQIIFVEDDKGHKIPKIVGMTQDGDYRLHGTYTPDNTEESEISSTTLEFVITRETTPMGSACNQLLGTAAGAKVTNPEGGGSLISIGNFDNPQNIVDDDPNNYATLIKVTSIAANVGIVRINFFDEKNNAKIINADQKPIRVGFTIQNTFNFLGIDLLKFFQVKLYKGDKCVDDGIVDKSNLLEVGLINGKGNKIRMSIKTSESFDRIELWTVGLLNLNAQGFRIYNAFWESAETDKECPREPIDEVCMEMLTTERGATFNHDVPLTTDAAAVGNNILNLGNLLDEDKTSYASFHVPVGVAGGIIASIKFPPIKGGKDGTSSVGGSTIGFIIEDPTRLLEAGVIEVIQLQVFSEGTNVTQKLEYNTLSLNVLGHSGRMALETQVTNVAEFDEVRLYIMYGAKIGGEFKIYGAFTRRDTDANGIPDCSEKEENPEDPIQPITKAEIDKRHICLHETLKVKVEGGIQGEQYHLNCYNYTRNNELKQYTLPLPEDGIFRLEGLPVGEYFIRINKDGKEVYAGALQAWVHPLLTTWKKNAVDNDWNNWDNWENGAPWTCTNVILPTGCARYPILKDLSKPTQATKEDKDLKNYCANLHIESHAELVNSHLLNRYDYVWTEMTLESGKNYILSSPLTNTVTGDYFIPAKWQGNHAQEHKFVQLTTTNTPENRFAPRIYQRCWSADVPGKVLTDGLLGTKVITSETDWTAPFNAVAEPIQTGMGWMVRAIDEGLPTSDLTFRFPKTHGEYSYFDALGGSTGTAESVTRNRETIGRFAVEKVPCDITVKNKKEGTTFVVGNPFMAHLNIKNFLEVNKDKISEVKLTNGNGTHTVLYQNGQITATAPGFTHIAPMQGFYVTTNAKAKELTLHFTAEMQNEKPGYNIYADGDVGKKTRTTRATAQTDVLRITADCGGKRTQCVVKLQQNADAGFRAGEDTRLLYDNENPPAVAVFTVADGIATDIQQLPTNAQRIDLGWRMAHPRKLTLQLSHPARSAWKGWALENRSTGKRINLDQTETFVDLGNQPTRIGGWRLVKQAQ